MPEEEFKNPDRSKAIEAAIEWIAETDSDDERRRRLELLPRSVSFSEKELEEIRGAIAHGNH